MNPDAAVVFDKAMFPKAIHKEAHARPGSADHIGQGFLRDMWNQCFLFPRLAEFGYQQKNPRQTLFAGVEKLIDKIGLGAHTAGQQESHEQIGEGMLLVYRADHLLPLYLERRTSGDSRRSRQA